MPLERLSSMPGALAGPMFERDAALEDWIKAVFLAEDGPLFDPGHAHLNEATLGCLWTNVSLIVKGQRKVGMAEKPRPPQGANGWIKGRWEQQMHGFFGGIPDFILTFDALYVAEASDRVWCALVDHELRHCVQEADEFGEPKFNRETGKPTLGIKGHDVEEFVATVRRFGVEAGAGETIDLVIAAARPCEVSDTAIARACGGGCCALKVA
jgi:hypothetical protein